ncbi:polysaccharide deacetylase family protein [Kitasatospora sp. RB6PN24]|uniref:polysaccharide deacetylase family protein n=1 Tax=Kitasatospora humi TaxID=2893891 RepID=UPI001E4A6BCD|nr:polysaccharide deacetylase family protein [Kitasatospora humi]MCC9307773.1 polysaccharide deacetylase family protein [Kitasatospora humi]
MREIRLPLSRRRLLAVGATALLGLACPPGRAVARTVQVPQPEGEVNAGPDVMALTFDDGPSPQYTPKVLDVLREHGVKATFFVCGDNIGQYPDVIRRMAAEGHVIGNHTWSHPNLNELSADDIRDQIQRTQDAVTKACGRTPVLFRAPYGNFSDTTLAVCADLGLRPISWSVDPEDWANPGTETIIDRVLAGAATGAIVLEHDGTEGGDDDPAPGSGGDRSQTVAALSSYLPKLLADGYTFTTPDAHPPFPPKQFHRNG